MHGRMLIVVSLLLACARHVHAQTCAHGWAEGPLAPDIRGADGSVHALFTYDPPGSPPPMLVVGGEFTHIGNIAANHIAAWDGSIWRALGAGTDGTVLALTVFNNNLIVGGDFDEADSLGPNSRHIAAWNGTAWLNIGNGLGLPATGASGVFVRRLVVFNGQLIAGGRILMGVGDFSFVFRLNGTTWQDVSPPGLFDTLNELTVLQVFDEDGAGPVIPLLYVGGELNAGHGETWWRWNGSTTWQALLPEPGAFPETSTVTNDGLVVGGSFTEINLGGGNFDDGRRVAAWDGNSWSPYGAGIGTSTFSFDEKVTALATYNNNFYAAGDFNEAGGRPASNMARWNGSDWFGTGIFFSGNGYHAIKDLHVHNGELIIAGDFNLLEQVTTGLPVNHLAKYNGTTFSGVQTTTSIDALAQVGSRVVMGGTFGHAPDNGDSPSSYYMAQWNGLAVTPLDGGVNAPVHALNALTNSFGSTLVVAGEFTFAGDAVTGVIANRIALYTEPGGLPPSWSAMGAGFNNTVLALERIPANQFLTEAIFAGGAFTASGSGATTFNRVAAWGGSPASWTTMGTGFNNTVRALKGFNTGSLSRDIFAGGDFTTASGASADRIAVFHAPNLHNEWTPMGSGFNNTVYAIERHNNSIYAGGAFTTSGAMAINHVARWNGTSWESVGGGLNGNVYALKSFNGSLYAACEVTVGGGLTAARFDGTSWASLEGGVTNGAGQAILPFQTELIFGGSFEKSGSGTSAVNSPGLARYRLQGLPWIVRHPISQIVSCHFDDVTFNVDVPTGYEGLVNYQWQKNGLPLTEGWTGTGSSRSGVHSPDLTVLDPSDADEGTYQLVISNACGTVSAAAVTLEVTGVCPACPIDIAPQPVGNGVVNIDDLLAVIMAWGACAAPCPTDVAPPGGNGSVNVDDLLAVITAWGACP